MRSSAEEGCAFCHVLRDAIQALKLSMKGAIRVRLEYTWKISQDYRQDTLGGDFKNGLSWLIAQIFTQDQMSWTGDNTEDEPFRSMLFLVESASSEQCRVMAPTVARIQKRSSLSRKHRNAQKTNKPLHAATLSSLTSDFHPTRLLDLEASDAADGIRLIQTEALSLEDRPQYAALSYCWGSELDAKAQLKLETSSLKDRLTNISWSSLPMTAQDAITVTRALSIRYLWIDALCIIQGDLRDWERESSRMGLIYSHAAPTICSLASSSCRESFLKRIKAIRIGFRSSIAPKVCGSFYLRYHPFHEGFVSKPPHDFRGELGLDYMSRNWARRAWTLQEYQFSNMVVLFGTSRTYFFGPQHSVAEPFETKTSSKRSQDVYYQRAELRVSGLMLEENQSIENWYDDWLELAIVYAHRESSLPEDKLPAISGLANRMAQETGDTYITGIWKGDLLRGVLWEDADRNEQETLSDHILATLSPQPYISPSWSWASRGRVLFQPVLGLQNTSSRKTDYLYDHNFRSDCTNLLATSNVHKLSQNPFGRIRSASIRLSGKLATPSSKLSPIQREKRIQPLWKFEFNERYTAFCELDWHCTDMKEMVQSEVKLVLLASTVGLGTDANYPADEEVTERRRRWEQGILDDGEELDRRNAWGLLIHPTGEPGQYIRVGRFTCRIEHGGVEAFQEIDYQDAELI